MTLLYVPVYPIKNRYPEEWLPEFLREFGEHDIHHIMIDGEAFDTEASLFENVTKKKHDLFTSLEIGARWEINQIRNMICNFENIKDGSTILFTDIDFPGFCLPFAQLFKLAKPNIKLYGYLHAGSYCNGDIFSNTPGKWESEMATLKIFDGVFVGSEYHKELLQVTFGPDVACNVHVVGAPFYGWELDESVDPEYDVVYTSRIDSQDDGSDFMDVVESLPHIEFVCTSKPPRKYDNLTHIPVSNREEYHSVLQRGRVYLNMAKEGTFGYGAVEAVYAGLIAIVPDEYAYPEVLKKGCIKYQKDSQIIDCIREALMICDSSGIVVVNEMQELAELDRWKETIPKMLEIMGYKK